MFIITYGRCMLSLRHQWHVINTNILAIVTSSNISHLVLNNMIT
jgi:hypothetical protein